MTIPETLAAALSGRYAIEREIGSGGMATVYLARDIKHDREVAVKVLRADLAAVLGSERFLAEVRITSKLDHPHILTLIDSGEAGGLLYYVMPFVRGESLRAKLNREKQLGVEEALAITREIGSALAYAHQKGIVHRDIKPENILLHEGEAVLTDFGIAIAIKEAGRNRLTESGLSLGTPQYMSPEQATGDRTLDARSDVYSLGAVLYEMLCGEPPVTGATAQAMIAKLLTERPTSVRVVRTTVAEALDRAVLKALEKVPADRFRSAGEFVQALEVGARTTGSEVRVSRRRGWGVAAVVGIAAVVLLGVGGLVWSRKSAGKGEASTSVRLGERKQVTFTGEVIAAAISDDGKTIAQTVEQCDQKGCAYSIDVQEIGGPVTRRVLEGSTVPISIIRWSPDRRTLMFWATLNGVPTIGLVSALGGPPTRLTSALGNIDFYGTDSIVSVDHSTLKNRGTIAVSGLDGVVRDRIPVLDSTEHRYIADVLAIAGSRWFLTLVYDERLKMYTYRAVDRQGRQVSAQSDFWIFEMQWASADALWRLTPMNSLSGTQSLVRVPFDTARGMLSGHADTVYTGAATSFSVTRDGQSVLISEVSKTTSTWAVEMSDLFRGKLRPETRVATSTSFTGSSISPDGQRILIGRVLVNNALALSVRAFSGGPEKSLDLKLGVFPIWADSVTLAYWIKAGNGSQLGLVDVGTGSIHDTLNLAQPLPGDANVTFGALANGGWAWKSANDIVSVQQRTESEPKLVRAPPGIDIVWAVKATRNGRKLAILGSRKNEGDSVVLVMMEPDGSSPVMWGSSGRSGRAIIANEPVAYWQTGLERSTSLFRFDGPGRAHKIGSIAVKNDGMVISDDLQRATLLTSENHGDAWIMRVIPR